MSRARTDVWTPRTNLGKMVREGKITSLNDIFIQNLKIQEPEIIDILMPEFKQEVLDINLVQKQTDAGERSRFKSIVVIGNFQGYFGVGSGKAKQVRSAIEKGVVDAKLNVIPTRRGCGSWECGCGELHSLPFKVKGKCSSVTIELLPAPKGLGLVAGENAKKILSFAGIKDCWTRSYGSTKTMMSITYATYEALKNTYRMVIPNDWAR